MSGLRFVKRKVEPFDAVFPQYRYILQMLTTVIADGEGGIVWQDVPVINEEDCYGVEL